MKLTKEEALWLADKFYDIFYALNVDEMYEKDQNIFRSIEKKLSEIKWWTLLMIKNNYCVNS